MPFRNKAQVSLEMMFILAIILAGIVLVSSVYYQSDTKTQLVYYIRTTATNACVYLSTGVVINDTVHSSLSEVIRAYNYSSLACDVSGINMVQASSTINVTVYINCAQPVNSSMLSDALREYIISRLSNIRGFSFSGGALYFRNYPLNIGVVVK